MTARSDYCLFRYGDTTYAFSTEIAGEIVEWRPHTVVAHAPRGLLGAFNLRGEIIPLISLSCFLERPEKETIRHASLLILASGNLRIAAGVDAVIAVQHIAPWQIHPCEFDDPNPASLIRGATGNEETKTLVLDGPALIARIAETIRAGFQHSDTKENEET